MNDFIGAGWAFPPHANENGGIAMVSGVAAIERAIRVILSTPIGERVMRPTFGSRLHELVFAPINSETMAQAERFVQEALLFWEPRIDVIDVTAGPTPRYDGTLLIEIRYRIKGTYDERSLVYPFYQIRGE